MKIISIEPTPSPNTMKLNMDESLPTGEKRVCTTENKGEFPNYIQRLLDIKGIKSIFQVTDFIAIERYSKGDWPEILSAAREIFGEAQKEPAISSASQDLSNTQGFGEVHVFIQMFKGIPMQIKLTTDTEEKRVGLPERLMEAVMEAQKATNNLVKEREWQDNGVRYGGVEEIGNELVEEISAAYPEERVMQLVEQALNQSKRKPPLDRDLSLADLMKRLQHPDWKIRFAALQQSKPSFDYLPALERALDDSHLSIRRLATAYLGMVESPDVLPLLYKALEDKSSALRRTAGDALSDLGNPTAIPRMTKVLADANKLVRWRAARFLYEVGDESALMALKEAEQDPEFEVSLQIKMAIERIEGGEEAGGTVWQQMTKNLSDER